jgi:hypothetical protein
MADTISFSSGTVLFLRSSEKEKPRAREAAEGDIVGEATRKVSVFFSCFEQEHCGGGGVVSGVEVGELGTVGRFVSVSQWREWRSSCSPHDNVMKWFVTLLPGFSRAGGR